MDGDQPERRRGGTHGPNGDFVATPETAEQDAEAARLRGRGLSYRSIAEQLDVSVSTAHRAVQRGLDAIRAEPAAEVRLLELERLDRMYTAVVAVLEREHFTVSQGRIIYVGGDPVVSDGKVVYVGGDPLLDDAPVLAAVDRLLKIQERRARLLGLDSETKVSVSGGVKYEIVGVPAEEL